MNPNDPNATKPGSGPGGAYHDWRDARRAQKEAWRQQRRDWKNQQRGWIEQQAYASAGQGWTAPPQTVLRRGSVIGPLILIVIGALFLLRNFWPEIPIADILANYWPLLLIVWGVLRLLEISFWAATSKPLPRHGVHGGEWVLVGFLIVFGIAYHQAHRQAWFFPDGAPWHRIVADMGDSFDYALPPKEVPAAANVKLVIENFRGNARITGADATTVKITGRKTVRAFRQEDADRADQETPFELVPQGSQIIVRTNQDRINGRYSVAEDLEIVVPKGASLEAHGREGDFDITGINGLTDISSDNAGVRAQNLGGDLRVDVRRSDLVRAAAVKGNVELKGRGHDVDLEDIGGQVTIGGVFVGQVQCRNLAKPLRYNASQIQLSAEKVPGEIHTSPGEFTASNLVGPVHLSARARDVQITDFTQSLDLDLDRGDIDLRPGPGPLPKIDARTHSGDVDLSLPAQAKFDLHASTDHGEVENDFGPAVKADTSGNGGSLTSVQGSGPQIRITTHRGRIAVRTAGSEGPRSPGAIPQAPRPPAPPIQTDVE